MARIILFWCFENIIFFGRIRKFQVQFWHPSDLRLWRTGYVIYVKIDWWNSLLLNMHSKKNPQNYWSSYPSETFTFAHFNVRHPVWPNKGNKNLSFVSCRFVLVFPFFHIRQCRSSDFLWPKKEQKNLFWKRMTAHEKLIIRTIQSYYFTLSQHIPLFVKNQSHWVFIRLIIMNFLGLAFYRPNCWFQKLE